jgi:RHS repeat-associated protein
MNGQALSKGYVPLPGGTQVKYIGTTISTYRVLDWLGSPRVGSNPNRTYGWGVAYAPFGERYASSGSPMWSFTGANGDTEPDLYDFQFRELHSSQGRWISPDPAGIAAGNPMNPQSLNRHAYVGNNPLRSVDPFGLDYEGFSVSFNGQITDYTSVDVLGEDVGASGFGGGCRFCNKSLTVRQERIDWIKTEPVQTPEQARREQSCVDQALLAAGGAAAANFIPGIPSGDPKELALASSEGGLKFLQSTPGQAMVLNGAVTLAGQPRIS